MQYAVIIYESQSDMEARSNPATMAAMMAPWIAYSQALREAGIMAGGAGLQPPVTATTVRVRDGKRQIQDGPFADTKELLGGFYVIDVPNLDKALEWAARAPNVAGGAVEVRPLLSNSMQTA